MARLEDERSIVPRPKGGPMQTRRFFVAGNPLTWAARGLARLEAGPAVQAVSMGAKILEDPTKAAKVADLTGDLAVRVVDAFTNKPAAPDSVVKPDKPHELEPTLPQWQLDFAKSVDYLKDVSFTRGSYPHTDLGALHKVTDIGVSIAEVDGNIDPLINRLQGQAWMKSVLTLKRAAGQFEDAEKITGARHGSWYANWAEHAKFKAKRGLDVSADLDRLSRAYYQVYQDSRSLYFPTTQLTDVAAAHFHAGTREYQKWMYEAEKAVAGSNTPEQAQLYRRRLVRTAIDCDDPLKAFEYVYFAKAGIKDVVLTNISASYEALMKLLRNGGNFNVGGHTTLEYMDVFARLGIENLDRYKKATGDITETESHIRYNNGGVKVFFHLMKEFANSQGVYSDCNFWHSQQAMSEGILSRHIPTVISNRIHWIRVQRMLGRNVGHETAALHNSLDYARTFPFDRARPNYVLAEGYRMAIEMQTDVGDVDSARATFAKMDEHLAGDNTEYLLAKADAMARIGIAQKKKELAVA